jgi:hypothetical protein
MLRILRASRPVRAAQRSVLVKLPVRSLATKPNTVVITDKAASAKVESSSELSGLDVPEVDDDADPAEADREFAFSMFGRELDELASKDLTPPDLSGYDPERVKEMDAIARKLADRFLGVVRTETAAESAPPRKAPRVAVMTAENMHQHELFEGRYLKSTKATKATESAPQAEAAEVDDPTDDVTDESIIEQLADSDGKMDGLEIESSAESIRSGMRSTERREIVLNEDDLEETFVRSSGPGGQCVNRRSTCVNLFHKPTATRIKVHFLIFKFVICCFEKLTYILVRYFSVKSLVRSNKIVDWHAKF